MSALDQHPTSDQLSAFALGRLDETISSVEEHVSRCPDCQQATSRAPDDTLVSLLRAAEARCGGATTPNASAGGTAVWEAGVCEQPTPPAELADHLRYHLIRPLGSGGMGTVWLAEHKVMGRRVALKVIRPEYLTRPGAAERFRREARAAARLHHPNIVAAHDAEQAGATHFLVMEYVEGVSLAEYLVNNGPLPVIEACRLARDAALGLQHAQAHGLVHRDIKPHNLILAPDGTLKILDFGLAALAAGADSASATGLTGANVVLGTPDYIAPEQAEDAHSADIRADIYSLGCTLYHMLAGRVPFPAESALRKLDAHRTRTPTPLAMFRPDVPPGLAAVLAKMMAKDPAARYQTPAEVAAALELFTRPDPVKPRRTRQLITALALLLAGVGLAGAVVYRIQTDRGELVITTESDDVEVVVKQGGKLVRVIDTKTDRSITLRSGVYELELKDAGEGLKLDIDRATLTRGKTVLARIERVPNRSGEAKGKVEVVKRLRWEATIYNIDLSPDGRLLLAGGGEDEVRVWDARSGELRHELHGGQAAFLSEGKQILALCGHGAKQFRLYDTETGRQVSAFGENTPLPSRGIDMCLAPDGKTVVGRTYDGTVRLWDVGTGKELTSWSPSFGMLFRPHFSPDGKLLVVRSRSSPAWQVWDIPARKETDAFARVKGLAGLATILPGSREVLLDTGDSFTVVEVATGKELRRIDWNREAAAGWQHSADGRRILAGCKDGTVRLYEQEAGTFRDVGRIDFGWHTSDQRFSADGRYGAVTSRDGHLVVIRLPDPPPAKAKP
jgi:tRNA A-37 threonylcarbamoyl transferase component Bud32